MDSTHPTAGWERVGDRFYRKTQLYTAVFDLDLDLDNFYVAGAPYGGAVGVLILRVPLPLAWCSVFVCWPTTRPLALSLSLRLTGSM